MLTRLRDVQVIVPRRKFLINIAIEVYIPVISIRSGV